MNMNLIIGILGAAATMAFADSELPPVGNRVVDEKTGIEYVIVEVPTSIDGLMTTTLEKAPTTRVKSRSRPLEPEATKRLHNGPVMVASLFETSGRARYAEKGGEVSGIYYYVVHVKARSEVIANETDASGKVFVKERRKFIESRDELSLDQIDVALALDTLPVDQVHDWTINAGTIAAGIAAKLGRIETAATITAGMVAIESGYRFAKTIDGTSARGLFGSFGVEIPEPLDVFVSKRVTQIAKRKLDKAHNKVETFIQSIEGKSFIITYEQEANGKPLDISYRNEDGSPISDAEWEILRQANLFLDQDMVPNTRCREGDSWNVWADEVQELFGFAGNGRAEGQIRVTRKGNRPDGDWVLGLSKTEIAFRDDAGAVSGTMSLKDGNGLVDGKMVSVKSLHATATGNVATMNKKRHAMFFDFIKRFNGKANIRFSLTVEPEKQGDSTK